MLTKEQTAKLESAIQMIETGVCAKVEVDKNIKVYAVKDIVRIDLNIKKLKGENNGR